jgi:hypothetical protein
MFLPKNAVSPRCPLLCTSFRVVNLYPPSEATGRVGDRAFCEIAGEGWALSFDR